MKLFVDLLATDTWLGVGSALIFFIFGYALKLADIHVGRRKELPILWEATLYASAAFVGFIGTLVVPLLLIAALLAALIRNKVDAPTHFNTAIFLLFGVIASIYIINPYLGYWMDNSSQVWLWKDLIIFVFFFIPAYLDEYRVWSRFMLPRPWLKLFSLVGGFVFGNVYYILFVWGLDAGYWISNLVNSRT